MILDSRMGTPIFRKLCNLAYRWLTEKALQLPNEEMSSLIFNEFIPQPEVHQHRLRIMETGSSDLPGKYLWSPDGSGELLARLLRDLISHHARTHAILLSDWERGVISMDKGLWGRLFGQSVVNKKAPSSDGATRATFRVGDVGDSNVAATLS